MVAKYDPHSNLVGGFSVNDGTMDFYLRVNSLLNEKATVLDFGAGRAAWFEDDKCLTRRSIRLLRGKVEKVIAVDVDAAVCQNRASDDQILIDQNADMKCLKTPVDLIVSDYVLEHIEDAENFAQQINDCLREGGWFCARTPHKYSYVAIFARLLKNRYHAKALSYIQPNRKAVDVFPTTYRLNTLRDVENAFAGWENKSFIFRTDPAYFFGNSVLYKIQSVIHRLLPAFLCGNLFVFVRKPSENLSS